METATLPYIINFAVPSSVQPSRNRQSFGHGVVGGSVAHAQVMNSERETSLRHQRTAINFASPPAPSPVPRRQARDPTAFVVPGTIDPHRSRSMRLNLLQGETEQQRSSVLNTLALGKIETATKRNGDNVPDMYKFSKSLPLTWWYNFSARCFTKNIYCPRPIDFSLSLPMGTDWENGGLPLKLYSRFHEYGTALKEDLIWCTKDMEKSITELISIAPNGYVALYNLIAVGMASFLQYNIVDASLLEYSRTDSIALRVRKVHEHVLQNHIIGNFPSQWQVWEYVVGRLPPAERNYLNNYAVQLLSDYPSCDRHNNVPVQLRIEFIASTITSALDVGGFKPGSSDRSNFPDRFVRSLEAADPCTNVDEEDAEDRMLHVVRKLSRSTKCFFCGSESHRWRDCVDYKVVDKKTGAPLASPDESTKQVAAIVDSAAQDSSIDDAIDLNVFTLSTLRTTSNDESSPFCYNCSSDGAPPSHHQILQVSQKEHPSTCSSRRLIFKHGRSDTVRALLDTGADAFLTPNIFVIHNFRLLPRHLWLRCSDAGGISHTSKYGGEAYISANPSKAYMIYFQPNITVTALDHGHLCDPSKTVVERRLVDNASSNDSRFVVHYDDGSQDVFSLDTFRHSSAKLLRHYTQPLLPIAQSLADLYPLAYSYDDIAALWHRQVLVQTRLNAEVTRVLWHHRLGHASDNLLSKMTSLATNVPPIKPKTSIEKCSSCLSVVTKRPKFMAERPLPHCRDSAITRFQHLQCDIGIMVQKSSDLERYRRLTSFAGNRVYFVLECMKTSYVFGICLPSKSPPLEWLQLLLPKITPWSASSRTIRMDEGLETSRNPALVSLFSKFGYVVDETGPDNSSAIGKVESFNRIIKTAIVRPLHSVSLSPKYWDLAFYHLLRIHNCTPRGACGLIPYTAVTGRKPDLKYLRIFGVPVSVRNYKPTPAASPNTVRGIFVGYNHSTKLPMFIPRGQRKPQDAPHCVFDETFTSYPDDELPPVAIALRRSLGLNVPVDAAARRPINSAPLIDILHHHDEFPSVFRHVFELPSSLPIGLSIREDVPTGRGYVSDVIPKSLASQIPRWRTTIIGSFIVQIGTTLVFTPNEIEEALAHAFDLATSFSVWFSSDIEDPVPPEEASTLPPKLSTDQLRHVHSLLCSLNLVTGEDGFIAPVLQDDEPGLVDGFGPSALSPSLRTGEDDESNPSIGEDPRLSHVHAITSKTTSFTRAALKRRNDWPDWQAAEVKQLDAMRADNMFGTIYPRSRLPPHSDVMRALWTYKEKLATGEKKARICGDGRHLRVPKHDMKIFQATATHQSFRMLCALAAYENKLIFDLDANNAFAQSGAFARRTFLLVDEVISDYFLHQLGQTVPVGSYIELLSSMQGHPDAGSNWQTKINNVLSTHGWSSCFHDPCLYKRQVAASDQFLIRQIDDMATAVDSFAEYESIVRELLADVRLTASKKPTTHFNGIQVEQTRHYIAIHVEKYIGQIMKNHGWENLPFRKKPFSPLSEQLARKILEEGRGPPVGTAEHKALELRMGFVYRTVLGEVIFAYIVVRLDIGYSVSLLSRAAEYPREVDYLGLKSVCRFLRAHADRPIVYWRRAPRMDLPEGELRPEPLPSDTRYTFPADPYSVFSELDSSHATDMTTRRSTGGHIKFWLASPIDWSAKLQRTLALNSTEAEFMQAVICSKSVIHTRHIADFLGRKQTKPSLLLEDNKAAIAMVNQGRPTDRARHIDVQWFAIQEWKRSGIIKMRYTPSALNSADAMTKALGSVLSTRHAYRAMGLYGSPYSYGPYKLTEVDLVDSESDAVVTGPIGEDARVSISVD